jgi:hypothetical protein
VREERRAKLERVLQREVAFWVWAPCLQALDKMIRAAPQVGETLGATIAKQDEA